MKNNTVNNSSLAQLLNFLHISTTKLVGLMNQKGATVLIRRNRNEIESLKELINERKVTYGIY